MPTCLACGPNPPTPSHHTGIPVYTQFATPELIDAICYAGHDPADDPAWRTSGATDQLEYGRRCIHFCGMACLQMVLHHRDGHAPPLFELADGATEYGAYKDLPDGWIRGLTYAPFLDYLRAEHNLNGDFFVDLPLDGMLKLVDDGQFVFASVHKEIRKPHLPPPRKGGHLVVITGANDGTVSFLNPSGHTPEARTANLPLDVFDGFYAGRGVNLRF